MAKKRNWDLIRKQKDTEKVKYRDVYEDQQLERGNMAEVQTMTSRAILAGVAALLVFIGMWTLISFINSFIDKPGLDDDSDPRDDWVFVEEHYYNADGDVLSVEDYEEWYKIYHDYDDERSSSDTVPDMLDVDLISYLGRFTYDSDSGMYKYVDPTATGPNPGYYCSQEEYQQYLFDYEKVYNEKRAEYELYYKRHTDPEYHEETDTGKGYKLSISYYQNISDGRKIKEETYNQLVEEYEASAGKLSEDIADIPLRPITMSSYYEGSDPRYITYEEYWHEAGLDTTTIYDEIDQDAFNRFLAYCTTNGISLSGDGPISLSTKMTAPDPNDAEAIRRYKAYTSYYNEIDAVFGSVVTSPEPHEYSELWNALVTYCSEAHYNRSGGYYERPGDVGYMSTRYVNRFDGRTLTYDEYHQLQVDDEAALDVYNGAYYAHRQRFHADNIDGTKTEFTMKPTFGKFFISLMFAAGLFGILYAFLKKNLDAQNIDKRTDDINQYKNDQHVALPEEIQANYDWFPDVGAHSAVQVSSMISHMALSNKGLKRVTVAKRAKSDILDDDGRVLYYKGDILRDDDGNPITTEEPIIDTDFMEELFDASGAPKDKSVRKYYDARKIPYNPDNANRDKLKGSKKIGTSKKSGESQGKLAKIVGKLTGGGNDKKKDSVSIYNTVADVINLDWDFPLYEPQRPAGAYIVDTAPVNTMV